MNESYIKNVIEAAMLAAGRPLQLAEMAALFDEASRPEPAAIRAALTRLEEDYSERGIEVKETATGFRIQVRKELANEVSRLWPERPPRYSRALLETLALIAYRQPITRAEIEAVRGVAVNPNIIKTLMERGWVRAVGHRDVPGRPELLATTKEFLDYFGLRSLEDLPPLAELKTMSDVGDLNLQLDLTKAPEGAAQGQEGAAPSTDAPAEGGSVPEARSDAPAGAASASEAQAGDASPSEDERTAGSSADEQSSAVSVSAAGSTSEDGADGSDGAGAAAVASGDADPGAGEPGDGESLAAVAASEAAAGDALEASEVLAEAQSPTQEHMQADAQSRAPEESPEASAEAAGDLTEDADTLELDDESGDDADEETASADPASSQELVAAPRHYED